MSDSQIEGQIFAGIKNLYGADQFQKIQKAHILVIGLGGVGSWCAEALARSGVGKLTLVDLDDICVTNINRQIHALHSTVGKSKIRELKSRLLDINPNLEIHLMEDFYTESSSDKILKQDYTLIIDAIDGLKHKVHLIQKCSQEKKALLTLGAAGGKYKAEEIKVADLAKSYQDPLLKEVRKKLRREHGFPKDKRRNFGITCVFSPEQKKLTSCDLPAEQGRRLNCETGLGSACFVTASFGMIAASVAINGIIDDTFC